MIGTLVVVAFLLIFAIAKAVVIVPDKYAYVVERMGRYDRTLSAGFHMITPIIDRIAFKHSLESQTEKLSDVYETKDGRKATVNSAFEFRVLDPQQASYGAANYLDSLRQLVRTSQTQYVASQSWDSLREDRTSFQDAIVRNAEAPAGTFGVRVLKHDVQEMELQD
jgi:regulator of protease activity HflC (stomatin/prohibitin superfamily)